MVNVVCGIRSTGRICTDLAVALEAQGHEVKIAYGRENVPEQFQKYAIRIGSDLDVKLHGLKARVLDGCGFGSKRATKQFIRWVREYDPDVIHLHNIHGYYVNIEVLFNYLRNCGKRIIWTLHDSWAFTGHTPYCDAKGCEKWKTGCGKCPGLKEYPRSYIDNSKGNWRKKRSIMLGIPNMTIVTPSRWLEGLVKESFLCEYPVIVIHNGIDTNQFYPMESDFKKIHQIDDKYMLLGVSTSWNEMKGLSDYYKLAEKLGEEYKVVLVGLSKDQLTTVSGRILGIERTNSVRELAQIYSAADLFLNLSYCENYPTVNLEAIACGTDVLTYDAGGSKESAFNGIVVRRGDLDAVIDAIKKYSKRLYKIDKTIIDNKTMLSIYLNTINKR